MLKSVLVAVDGTKSSDVAENTSINLCKQYGAQLSGVALLERPMIAIPTSTMGADFLFIEDKRQAAVLHKIDERSESLLKNLESKCVEQGLAYTSVHPTVPINRLLAFEAESHDLTIIGHSTTFDQGDDETSDVALDLARQGRRPVVITPDNQPSDGKVVIGFDGSNSSSRTLQLFVLLGLYKSHDVEVICIDEDVEKAKALVQWAGTFLQHHGIDPVEKAIPEKNAASDILLEHAEGASMLVIGAFGNRSIRELIFGSTTNRILRACPVPIFLYH